MKTATEIEPRGKIGARAHKSRNGTECSKGVMETLSLLWEFQAYTGGEFIDWCQRRGVRSVFDVAGENGEITLKRIRIKQTSNDEHRKDT